MVGRVLCFLRRCRKSGDNYSLPFPCLGLICHSVVGRRHPHGCSTVVLGSGEHCLVLPWRLEAEGCLFSHLGH